MNTENKEEELFIELLKRAYSIYLTDKEKYSQIIEQLKVEFKS